jgi:hypothetical protein
MDMLVSFLVASVRSSALVQVKEQQSLMRRKSRRSIDRAPRPAALAAAAMALSAAVLALSAAAFVPAASATVMDVTLDGNGTGTVVSNPAGIRCANVPGSSDTACSHDFGAFFGQAKLTATAAEGSAFLAWSGNAGGTCAGATNPCDTGFIFMGGAPMAVTATFAPKPSTPAVTTGAVSDAEFPSARVSGSVNPDSDDFAILDCYFEYGLTTEYGDKAECRPGPIGTGTSPVAVSASIGVLEPARTYHYRLVASNGAGVSRGEDRTFTSAAAPADGCANAAIRAQQGALAQRLPNCGAYELVSPPFTGGQSATVAAVGTADGNRVMLQSVGGFAGVENLPDLGVLYATGRTGSGWTTSAIAPPAKDFPYIGSHAALDFMRDGSRSLWFVNLKADEGSNRFTPIVREPDGTFHVAGGTQDDQNGGFPVLPVATSGDLRTVVQHTFTRLPLTDGTVDSRSAEPRLRSLYASTRGADGQLSVRQVAYRNGATMFPDCEAHVGGLRGEVNTVTTRNAVSSDGQKIFFTAGCSVPEHRRVWVKIGDADPVDLSASQCPTTCGPVRGATFRGASRDGSRVYFTTEQQLLPEDEDTSDPENLLTPEENDLYEYDFNAPGQKLRLVTGGAGALIRSFGLLRVSDDGAYAYFVGSGRALTGENRRGVAPQPGADNLYVYHRPAGQANGTTTFVGPLEGAFSEYPQTSTTGRFILLHTTSDLTGERLTGDGHADHYRYDAQADEMMRVWTDDPAHNGVDRVDGPAYSEFPETSEGVPGGGMQMVSAWGRDLRMSEDGSLVGFTTAAALSRDDHNTRTDAYSWHAETGRITLLTDGTSRPGNRFNGSRYLGMTPSGDSLFVVSASPLLKVHASGQNAVYAVRRDGGFPDEPAPSAPCAGESCRGPAATSPAAPVAGSVHFSGPGNAPSTSVSVSKLKTVVGSVAKVKVKVPEAGRISVTGASVRKASRSAARAQTVTMTVALTARAKRTLKKHRRSSVKVRVAFEAGTGGSASKAVTITFKQPKANKKGGR